MEKLIEELIYILSLLLCVALGSYYKSIDDLQMKKSYGTGMGLVIVCLVCRQYFIHSFFMVMGNIVIVRCCDKRYLHQLSLTFTWLYLLYIDWNLKASKYVLWIHQALALRLVGLAFEIHLADKSKAEKQTDGRRMTITPANKPGRNSSATKIKTSSSTKLSSVSTPKLKSQSTSKLTVPKTPLNFQEDLLADDPSPVDILSYAYFFVGIHRGPYYRIKVLNDYFNLPFSALCDCRPITMDKLKNVAVWVVVYVVIALKFPTGNYEENEFYRESSAEYRFMYNIPQLALYVLEHQIILTLCTCVYTESGFGIYPTKWQSIPGLGPSHRNSGLKFNDKRSSEDVQPPLEEEYNFSMIKCFDNEKLIMGPMMKDTIRAWEMPTQYWFWAYIYKSLIKSNKEVRSACSFLVWSVWRGPKLSQVLLSTTIWAYIHLENEYDDLYNNSASLKMAWDIGYSIMRMLCLVYMTPCLMIMDSPTLFRYYTSIYWAFHILLIILIVSAAVAYKMRESENLNSPQ